MLQRIEEAQASEDMEIFLAFIEDHEVDNAIKYMDFSKFSAYHDVERKLRAMSWNRRKIFKLLG